MALAVKPGVLLASTPQVATIRAAVNRVWSKRGLTATITSGLDGTHKRQSKHYEGLAEDYRTKDLPQAWKLPMFEEVRLILGSDYDVVFESPGTDNEHLHVEFDPK